MFDEQNAKVNSYLLIQKSTVEDAKERILSGSLEDDDDDEENDGSGLLPESLKRTQDKGDKPLQSLVWSKGA